MPPTKLGEVKRVLPRPLIVSVIDLLTFIIQLLHVSFDLGYRPTDCVFV
jgi:hypothetical protein